MKVAAVIQARMGSTRFPGKVLAPLAGKPILWHVIHRLRRCKTVGVVAVATSSSPSDDPLERFCAEEGVPVIRGPEHDVLRRYVLAQERFEADVIVRVTGDAPLVDPGLVDQMVLQLTRDGADWCTGDDSIPSLHEGFDLFTAQALRKLSEVAGDDPVAREHVSAYFKQHPGFVRATAISIPESHRYDEHARMSVDTPADLRFLEALYRSCGASTGALCMDEVVRALRDHPQLSGINRHVRQKTATERTRTVVFRCDGDETVGLGHTTRCLAVAEELRDRLGWGVTFAMMREGPGAAAVRRVGFGLEIHGAGSEASWLDRVLGHTGADALVLDIRTDLPRASLERWRERACTLAVIDDPHERRLAADLAFYPPVPTVFSMDWSGFDGTLLVGWEWIPLRKGLTPLAHRSHGPPHVLVTMGGVDPAGLTARVVSILSSIQIPMAVTVLLGPAFSGRNDAEAVLSTASRPVRIVRAPQDPVAVMREADLAVVAFGTTAYELAALGVPTVLISLDDDHARSASAFHGAGMALSVGVHDRLPDQAIAEAVMELLSDPSKRQRLGSHGRNRIDGQGRRRIAERIAARVRETEAGPATARER